MSNYGPSARYYMGLAEKARAAAVPELPPAFSEFLGNLSDMMMLDGASASGAATEPGGGAAATTEYERELARAALSKHVKSGEYTAADLVKARNTLNPDAATIARRAADNARRTAQATARRAAQAAAPVSDPPLPPRTTPTFETVRAASGDTPWTTADVSAYEKFLDGTGLDENPAAMARLSGGTVAVEGSEAAVATAVDVGSAASETGLAARLGAYTATSAEGSGLAGYLMVNSEIAANVGAMISSSAAAGAMMTIGAIGAAAAGAYLTYQGIANAMENTQHMIAARKEAMRIAYRIQVFDHIQKTNPTMWAQLEANYGWHQQHARELPGQPPITDDLLSKIDQQISTANDAYWHNLGWSRNSPSLQGLINARPTNTIAATVAAGAAAHAALPHSSDMHYGEVQAYAGGNGDDDLETGPSSGARTIDGSLGSSGEGGLGGDNNTAEGWEFLDKMERDAAAARLAKAAAYSNQHAPPYASS